MEPSTIILVVADSNFINLCQDPHAYVKLLKERIAVHRKDGAVLYTVSGRYGMSGVDPSIPVISVNDRNKTLFGQTLENSAMLYDELMAITIASSDPFIEIAKEVVTNANKTFTHYRYPGKSHGR